MGTTNKPDHLILNSPFEEPREYWEYVRETRAFRVAEGRRKSGYTMATPNAKGFDDPGVFKEIPLVNAIRPRVAAWRRGGVADWPGVTGTTRRLLEHWSDATTRDGRRFFYCQMEAIETLIWLLEADPAERVGVEIPGDGGAWARQCCKMATGTGKTLVMAMVLAWQFLNRAAYPQDGRFARHALIMAPGITVRSRLEVLRPDAEGNYYELFQIVPGPLMEMLRRAEREAELRGGARRYRPDYLARRTDGIFLIIETKGRVTPEVLAKKAAAEEWIEAVNATGRFGEWRYALCEKPQQVLDALG